MKKMVGGVIKSLPAGTWNVLQLVSVALRAEILWGEAWFDFLLCFLWRRDEDMQSLASLMSMKQADIGNLDDFEEENEEDEENKVNQEEKAAKITGDNAKKCLVLNVFMYTTFSPWVYQV